MDFENSGSPGRFFSNLVRELKSIAISNIEYFKDGKLSHHAKFHVAFCMLFEYLDLGIEPYYREIYQRVSEYDASPDEKGNGYRSQLRIVQKCCLTLLQISRHIATNRESMLFRRVFYMKELEGYVAVLGQLRALLYYSLKIMTHCPQGMLIPDDSVNEEFVDQMLMDVEMLSVECFYGRCLGFQVMRKLDWLIGWFGCCFTPTETEAH
jgi:hormone-sensitive lipase